MVQGSNFWLVFFHPYDIDHCKVNNDTGYQMITESMAPCKYSTELIL